MDVKSQGALVNVLGFLYASLGFSLSVLAAVLATFQRSKLQSPTPLPSQPRLPSTLRGPPTPRGRHSVRVCSDNSLQVSRRLSRSTSPGPSPTSPSTPVRHSQMNRQFIAAHRRSRSIPLITIDFFGSTDNLSSRTPRILISEPSEFITANASPVYFEPEPLRNLPAISGERMTQRTNSLVSQLKSKWGKDKDRPKVHRAKSSPQMRDESSSLCSKDSSDTLVDGQMAEPVTKSTKVKDKRRNTLRKTPCVTAIKEECCIKFDPAINFAGKVEKKRSATVLRPRTQPYEAPYFCSPPTVTDRSLNKSSPDKHSKPRILVPS